LRVLRQAGLVLTRRDVIDGRLIYYVVKKKVVAGWRTWLNEFLDPARDHERLV
jgi:hypothetical protein